MTVLLAVLLGAAAVLGLLGLRYVTAALAAAGLLLSLPGSHLGVIAMAGLAALAVVGEIATYWLHARTNPRVPGTALALAGLMLLLGRVAGAIFGGALFAGLSFRRLMTLRPWLPRALMMAVAERALRLGVTLMVGIGLLVFWIPGSA